MNNNCVILIPALDPPEIFLSYIDELIQVGFKDILVVDDGSHQKKIFEKIGSLPQVTVLTHPENYGKGRALRTGLAYYKDHYSYDEYCGVITADSDGQHLVDDVLKISKSLAKREDKMILGVPRLRSEQRSFQKPHRKQTDQSRVPCIDRALRFRHSDRSARDSQFPDRSQSFHTWRPFPI